MIQAMNPAQVYEDYLVSSMFRPIARDLVQRAAPQPGERVLDIACGTGVVSRLAAPLVKPSGTVTGLDISPGMLGVARERAAAEGLSITWQNGNACELPFGDGSFDLVTCQQGLQFVPDRVAALREMRRVLAPGGRALISCWSPISAQPVFAAIEVAAIRHLGFSPLTAPYSIGGRDALETLVRSAGFSDVDLATVRHTALWPSYFEYLETSVVGIIAAVPAMASLTTEQRAGLVDAIKTEVTPLVEQYLDGDVLSSPVQTDVAIARG